MSFRQKLLSAMILPCLMLAGCGGNDGSSAGLQSPNEDGGGGGGGGGGGTGGDGSGGGTGGGGTSTTNVSYLPLSVYEAYSAFSGYESDGMFQGYGQDPYIDSILINPVNATTLAPVRDEATASDFQVTVDTELIDETESFPLLQQVIGTPIQLRTALVFDLSDSVHSRVNMQALITEAKAYVTDAKNSDNPIIRDQEFVIWGFASSVAGFDGDGVAPLDDVDISAISDAEQIDAALEEVLDAYDDNLLGTGTNLHKAVVQAIGRYNEDEYAFDLDGDNDLVDMATMDFILASQMVVFSTGPETSHGMSAELMTQAINSQSFLKYDPAASPGSDMIHLKKPVFYYVVGGDTRGTTYAPLSAESEEVTQLTLREGAYTFASDLIEDQLAAIDDRIDLDNQYVYRYAFVPREGEHTAVFKSNTSGHNYSLTSTYTDEDFSDPDTQGTPEQVLDSLVEITGPNGEYLSLGMADIEEVTIFAPATRWTNTVYTAANYSWTGVGVEGEVSDGRFTVTGMTEDVGLLTLTNNVRGESATIILTDSNPSN